MQSTFRPLWALAAFLLAAASPSCQDSAPAPSPPKVAALGRLLPAIQSDLDQATAKVTQNPKDWKAWANLGVRYEIHSAPAPALTCYTVAADHMPDDAQWAYRAAVASGKAGQPDLALTWIERSLKLDPKYGTSHYRKGNWLLDLGRIEESKAAFQQAADLAPDGAENWGGLARVALQNDQPEVALNMVKKARKLSSSDPYLHLLLGITLSQLGRESEAEAHLALGQGSSPTVNDPWSRIVSKGRTREHDLLSRGQAMEEKGDWSGAIRAYREIMVTRPDEIRLPLRLARTLLKANRNDEALQLIEETRAKYPSHLDILTFHGALLSKNGDSDGAWEACNQALRVAPDRPDGYNFKSTLLAQEGKHREALAASKIAVDLAPAESRGYEALAQRYGALKEPWDAVRVLEGALDVEGFKPSKRFYQMLIQGLTAIKRTDKVPAILKKAQADFGTKAFPN